MAHREERKQNEEEASERAGPKENGAATWRTRFAVLQSLPDRLREAIVFHCWGKLGFAEMAQVKDCSVETARHRYLSGLRLLREKMNMQTG